MNEAAIPDLFQWELPPDVPAAKGAEPGAVAFGLPETSASPDMPIWRVDFPADPEQAARQVQDAQRQAAVHQAHLEALPARFEGLAQRAKSAGTSFAAPGALDAESELLTSLANISTDEAQKAVSFGLLDRLGGWSQVNDQFQAFTDRLQRTLAHLAWVETRQAGHLIGQTVVGWSGDNDTLWAAVITPEQVELHCRSLETALQSRTNMLRTFTLAVQGAVKLSVILSTPGGAILALPTVWKYISQILAAL